MVKATASLAYTHECLINIQSIILLSVSQYNSNLNDGKYWRAYTTTFAFGREIPAGKDMTFDLNISFPARPSVLVIIPSTAKITNVRYDFDNSTSTKTRIIFDNEGATIPADAMVRMGVIAIK